MVLQKFPSADGVYSYPQTSTYDHLRAADSDCNSTTPHDYTHVACLPWCSKNVKVNCPRCKCMACPFCKSHKGPSQATMLRPPPCAPSPWQHTLPPLPPALPPLTLLLPPPPPPPSTPSSPSPPPSPPQLPSLLNLGADHGLCSSLAPASLIVGDSVSGQFFRAISELLGAARRKDGGRGPPEKCHGLGCEAIRALPSYAQTSLVCNRSVWIAYIRNDWLDVASSYPVPDGNIWNCARDVDEYAPELRVAVRKTTHLCGRPSPMQIACGGRPCLQMGATTTHACSSTCALAMQNFSCGAIADPCAGCSAAWSVPALCDTVSDRSGFCRSTEEGAVPPSEDTIFHTAHCLPWSSPTMLRNFRVVVLNAGAHRVPMDVYRRKMQHLAVVIRGYLSSNPAGVAVFRTTVPGFSGCNETRNTKPHVSIAAAEAYLQDHPFYDQHAFVPIANRIASAEMMQVGVRILDVYPASILRLDDRAGTHAYNGGLDCLHYRFPLLETSLALWTQMLGDTLHKLHRKTL